MPAGNSIRYGECQEMRAFHWAVIAFLLILGLVWVTEYQKITSAPSPRELTNEECVLIDKAKRKGNFTVHVTDDSIWMERREKIWIVKQRKKGEKHERNASGR